VRETDYLCDGGHGVPMDWTSLLRMKADIIPKLEDVDNTS
jgi:hypothetical protein